MLEKDVRKRVLLSEVLQHPWLQTQHCVVGLSDVVMDRLRSFANFGFVQRGLLQVCFIEIGEGPRDSLESVLPVKFEFGHAFVYLYIYIYVHMHK